MLAARAHAAGCQAEGLVHRGGLALAAALAAFWLLNGGRDLLLGGLSRVWWRSLCSVDDFTYVGTLVWGGGGRCNQASPVSRP